MSETLEAVYERRALYYETDQMGIVHHSNYIRWFEESRLFYMEQRGYPYKKMEELGVMIPVLSADCEYHVPVKFAQTVLIRAQVLEFSGTRLRVGYEVRDKETGRLHACGHTSHCFVNADSFRPIRLTKSHPDMAAIFTAE